MARFVYAKIYCDILRHPLLRSRPDCDVRLVLGLLLEAKEHTDDGVLRNLTAADARELCHIKAPAAKVQAGIDYLVSAGWLIPHPELAYEIKDFVSRQAADSAAERMSRSRDRRRDDPVTKRNGSVYTGVTPSSPDTDGEVEVEKEVDQAVKARTTSKSLAGKVAKRPSAAVVKLPVEGETGVTVPTRKAYEAAYFARYGVTPPSSSSSNGMLAQFLARVPAADAPGVAEFYVSHNRALYVSASHSLNLLMRDAQKLWTEWKTGHQVTDTEARQIERTQASGDVFKTFLKEG